MPERLSRDLTWVLVLPEIPDNMGAWHVRITRHERCSNGNPRKD